VCSGVCELVRLETLIGHISPIVTKANDCRTIAADGQHIVSSVVAQSIHDLLFLHNYLTPLTLPFPPVLPQPFPHEYKEKDVSVSIMIRIENRVSQPSLKLKPQMATSTNINMVSQKRDRSLKHIGI
jgi:hypothetical protein